MLIRFMCIVDSVDVLCEPHFKAHRCVRQSLFGSHSAITIYDCLCGVRFKIGNPFSNSLFTIFFITAHRVNLWKLFPRAFLILFHGLGDQKCSLHTTTGSSAFKYYTFQLSKSNDIRPRGNAPLQTTSGNWTANIFFPSLPLSLHTFKRRL